MHDLDSRTDGGSVVDTVVRSDVHSGRFGVTDLGTQHDAHGDA